MKLVALDILALVAGERTLFEGLTLEIRAGECWAVLGENGAGKSTLLRAMAGLIAPAAGTIALEGRPVLAWAPRQRARRIAWMPQHDDDAFSTTVLDALLAARHPWLGTFSQPSAEDDARALAALAEVDLVGFAERDLATLSGGERRRVALAAACLQDTPIRLLDEPFAGLDPRHQSTMLALVARTLRADGATVFTTHDPNHALALATHVLALDGATTLQGPAATMLDARVLSTLYRCEIALLEQDGRRAFAVADPVAIQLSSGRQAG